MPQPDRPPAVGRFRVADCVCQLLQSGPSGRQRSLKHRFRDNVCLLMLEGSPSARCRIWTLSTRARTADGFSPDDAPPLLGVTGRIEIFGVGMIMRCSTGISAGTALLTLLIGCHVFAATGTPSQPASRNEDGTMTTEQKALEAGVQSA
jgi:hypothetical protein